MITVMAACYLINWTPSRVLECLMNVNNVYLEKLQIQMQLVFWDAYVMHIIRNIKAKILQVGVVSVHLLNICLLKPGGLCLIKKRKFCF